MKWSLNGGNVSWPDGTRKNHKIGMDLDMVVADFVQSNSPEGIRYEIESREFEVRQKLMRMFVGGLVPTVIRSGGGDTFVPGKLNFKSTTEWDNSSSINAPVRGRGLAVRNNINLLLNIETDRPTTAVQALYADRAGLATTLADSVMASLKQTYLGQNSTSNEHSTRLINNEIIDHKHRNKPNT